MVLADTSVWVDYLRGGQETEVGEFEAMLDAGELAVCGPVLAELLAGTGRRDRAPLELTMRALPWAALDREAWSAVGGAAAELRRRGERIPLTDIEIGVAAARSGAILWTRDKDFVRVRAVVDGLVLRGV